ncbi:FliA/WhiG family RNA polymerase sigma factor [Neobacillus mesonae]|uniref:sigma-70 family RNA polymerase sigma factor n=1 Tax=Neobacillus mesonae TaxID=1193713 RepID=UPI00203F1636|nr:FliA/WhiG family RNA polymerase sigma factor [Neobacillus mesonae]MCM3569577.1 FliA/WhiG family RNA polymerase sigma factor [Neobacillus mesonae]
MKPVLNESNLNHQLWSKYQTTNDLAVQEKLVKQYMYLVERMANRLSLTIPQRIIPKEDLMGLGFIGLIEAVKNFDYTKGYQFETFGLWRIKGAMLDGVRKMDWIPRGLREKVKKLNGAFRDLEQTLLRSPTEEELASYLDMPVEEVDQTMSALSFSTLLSLDEPMNDMEDDSKQQSRLDYIRDEHMESQEQQIQMAEFKKIMAECIDEMPKNEKLVLTLLYYEGLTQVEIAEVLNLTKGRISQIHSKAIVRLRRKFENMGFSFHSFV